MISSASNNGEFMESEIKDKDTGNNAERGGREGGRERGSREDYTSQKV